MRAREAALTALTAFRRRGARPDMALANSASKYGMDRRETALAQNIMNGVLQQRALCDFYISGFTDIKKLEPTVLDILRLSAYQICFLTRVPKRAAVSEGVELSKKYAPKASGLVNAVLRRLSEAGDSLPKPEMSDEEERLSVLYSHPKWLVSELSRQYGAETCEKILAADNTPSSVTVQTNRLRCTSDELKKALESEGASVERHPFSEDALKVSGAGAIDKLKAFENGLFYVQDVSAHFAALAAGAEPGMTVLDVCAAPGGKSFALAVQMQNSGRIISRDIHEKKLRQISEGASRLGIDIIETGAGDAREDIPELYGKADVVIADVPCSGLGVIRKKPEIRYKDPEELKALPGIQRAVLNTVSKYVKTGGTLLYSTCTILKRENEDVVREFLAENSDFSAAELELPAPFMAESGMRTILPCEGDTDGFFICKMKRIR